jgi:hypothetical protein
VAENDMRFRGVNLLQQWCHDAQKFLWVVEHLADERIFQMTKKPEVRGRKIRTVQIGRAHVW